MAMMRAQGAAGTRVDCVSSAPAQHLPRAPAPLQVLANPVQGCPSALPCSKPAHTENKPRWNIQLTCELVTEERDISQTHLPH